MAQKMTNRQVYSDLIRGRTPLSQLQVEEILLQIYCGGDEGLPFKEWIEQEFDQSDLTVILSLAD
jgi:hypothetical protein